MIASISASTELRETLRAVSSTFRWSAASAVSNSFWSSENSGAEEAGAPFVSLPCACTRRYSSRAAACSSGKPSKPSACEKRTTVELDVFARRASSSAVWKAASSRWSTMYWATSFCEREHSSKRAWMYLERLWWSLVPLAGGRSWVGVPTRFIGALFDAMASHSCPAPTGRDDPEPHRKRTQPHNEDRNRRRRRLGLGG